MVKNIQVLRAFAALAVVWRHMTLWFETDPGFGLMHSGRAGVDVFFVISGFIMFHTTQDKSRSTLDFWKDRLIRIVPLYWIITLATIGLFVLGLPSDEVKALNAGDIIAAFGFLPNVRADGDWNPIVNAGWTLTYEMFFYGLFGLTFFLKSQARALALLTVFFVAIWLIGARVNFPFPLFRWSQPITLEFAAGGLLALLYRMPMNWPEARARWIAALLIIAGVIGILVNGWIFGDATAEPTPLRTLVYGPFAAMIVAGALLFEKSGVVWNSRTLLLLGAASYSIYLLHSLTLQYAALAWRELFGASVIAMPFVAAAGMVTAALVGVAVYLTFERPAHLWLKTRLGRRRAMTATA